MNGRLLFGVMSLLIGLGSAAGAAPAQAQFICSVSGTPDRLQWTSSCDGETNTENPTSAGLYLSSVDEYGWHWSWHITNQLVCTDDAPLYCAFSDNDGDYFLRTEGNWDFTTDFPPQWVSQYCQCGSF
jgi:hypothetical protein